MKEHPEFTVDPNDSARLAAIVESSFDAIISKNLNSVITSWNSAATRTFGYTAREAIGSSVLMLIPPEMQNQEDDIIARITRGERVESFETVRLRKDGSPIDVSLTISPIRAPNGAIVGASKIARDITAAREAERKIGLLLDEVTHRVKNQYAVILSIIRESSNRASSPREFEEQVQGRIMALSRTHDLLVKSQWSGASLEELVRQHLSIFGSEDRLTVSGPMLTLRPNAPQYLGMALHELGTNAVKYGALAHSDGRLEISWWLEGGIFRLLWQEKRSSSATPIKPSSRHGFGSVVLERVVPLSLEGKAELAFRDDGLQWNLHAPIEQVLISPRQRT